MTRQYSSFLIRCWRLDDGEQRIKNEHIQTGEGLQAATLAAAFTWIESRWDGWTVDGALSPNRDEIKRGRRRGSD